MSNANSLRFDKDSRAGGKVSTFSREGGSRFQKNLDLRETIESVESEQSRNEIDGMVETV